MPGSRNQVRARESAATPAAIRAELHRLRESKMLLVLKAQVMGLSAPRSCCRHVGAFPCPSCSADWLVAVLLPRRRRTARSARSSRRLQ